jgi:transposase
MAALAAAAAATRDELVGFLTEVVNGRSADQEIPIILDNLSAYKTAKVQTFLKEHPHVRLHFTPTYFSRLSQVEIWFSKLPRDVIIRGVFTSVQDLARKIMRYIRQYSKTAQPLRWKYSDVRRRIPKY